MKTKYLEKLTLLLVLAVFSTSAMAEKTNSQNRNVSPFSKIKVSSGIDLYLTQGAGEAVKVVADEDLIDRIITEVEGETLHIYIKNKTNWNWGWKQERKVYVTFDNLTELNASAGSDVEAEGPVKVKEINISASSGSDVNFDHLTAEKVGLDASSGADINIAGETIYLNAESSSGSDIDCKELISENCRASASSGSDITLYVTKSLSADASSGGDIRYKGNPHERNTDESSGGDVSSY